MQRVAIYARTSTEKGQTTENQLRQLTEAGVRLGWTVVAVHTDAGVSGTKGRDRRPGFDALLRGVARREFDMIAVWSICRLGRSLQHLVGFLAEVHYTRQQSQTTHFSSPPPHSVSSIEATHADGKSWS